jgi:hypothetical protein
MTDREMNEPNEYGFAGGATGPEPEQDPESARDAEGEGIAVPSGDLTGSITGAIESLTDDDNNNNES